MVIYNKDEIFILTNPEMEQIKKQAFILLDALPKHYLNSLIVIAFLKEHLEETLHRKVKGIKIVSKAEQDKEKNKFLRINREV